MKNKTLLPVLLALACAGPAFGQQRVFNWLPADEETVRLDPANFHAGRTYHPGPNGGNIHVEIKGQMPFTVFLTGADEWNEALQHPEKLYQLHHTCQQQHVVQTTYLCDLPAEAMTLIVQDERNGPDPAAHAVLGLVLNSNDQVSRAVNAGLKTVLTVQAAIPRHFVSPNDVRIQYFRWNCVENCIQPEFQWIRQIKEKYELTSFLKVYGGYQPTHDGEAVSIKIKSPVPMVVAMVPSSVANQLYSKPEMLDTALEKSACQQRGVQSLQFECPFNAEDGPQSLVIAPESGVNVPHHKKAEVEMLASKCVENCIVPERQ